MRGDDPELERIFRRKTVVRERVGELLRSAEERGPAVNCLTNPVKTSIQVSA